MTTFMNKQRFAIFTGIMSLFLLTACNNGDSSNTSKESENSATAWDNIQEEGSITVATSGTLFPTSYRDENSDELTGFEVEVVR